MFICLSAFSKESLLMFSVCIHSLPSFAIEMFTFLYELKLVKFYYFLFFFHHFLFIFFLRFPNNKLTESQERKIVITLQSEEKAAAKKTFSNMMINCVFMWSRDKVYMSHEREKKNFLSRKIFCA